MRFADMEKLPFVPDDDSLEDVERFTISLTKADYEVVEALADFWSELRRARTGKTRVKRWKRTGVIARFVASQIDALSQQMGVDLRNEKARTERMAEIVAEEKRAADEKRAKKRRK
jgi:hypothetical protein